MLTKLDKKLAIQINKKIRRKNNRRKFNIYNTKAMSIGWVFVSNIFLFILLGYLTKKHIIDSAFIFIVIMLFGIAFAFLTLKNLIKKLTNK